MGVNAKGGFKKAPKNRPLGRTRYRKLMIMLKLKNIWRFEVKRVHSTFVTILCLTLSRVIFSALKPPYNEYNPTTIICGIFYIPV